MRTIFNETTIFVGRQSRNFIIDVCYGCKYNGGKDSETQFTNEYKNLKAAEIMSGEEVEQFFHIGDNKDEYDEYLVLTLEDGTKTVYQNSHVDMFHV